MRTRAVVVAAATGEAVLAAAATAWACVAGIALQIDRVLVAPGGELGVSITVAGSPNPKPVALRLDQLDAVPLAVVVPSALGPSVVRVAVPAAAGGGQHILIANDERPPARGEHGYLTARALFSVVDARLAAGNPTVETTIDFALPLPYNEFSSQFGAMGADLVRLHYIGMRSTGEFVNRASHPARHRPQHLPGRARRRPPGRGIGDRQRDRSRAGRAGHPRPGRRSGDRPPGGRATSARRADGDSRTQTGRRNDAGARRGQRRGLPWAAVAVAGALLVATAVGAARVRASTGG